MLLNVKIIKKYTTIHFRIIIQMTLVNNLPIELIMLQFNKE